MATTPSDKCKRVTRLTPNMTRMTDDHLIPAGRMGQAHVLWVTEATGRNPLKVANEIATRTGVAACHPQVLLALERHGSGVSAGHPHGHR